MNEIRVKKAWLVLLFAQILSSVCFFLCAYFLLKGTSLGLAVQEALTNRNSGTSLLSYLAILLLGGLISGGIGAWILISCAYKKPGTKLLFLTIFIFTPYHIFTQFKYIAKLYGLKIAAAKSVPDAGIIFYFLAAYLLSDIILDCIWIYFSYKLRKINKKTQEQNIRSVADYQPSIVGIESAVSIEDALKVYQNGVRNYPQISGFLKKRYQEKIKNLKS